MTARKTEARDLQALRLLSKDEVRRKSLGELWRSHSIDNRVRRAVERLFAPEADAWLVGRLARNLDGITRGDIKAALGRARISLDFPAAEPAAESGQAVEQPAAATASYDVTVADLIENGLIRPGAELRKTYLGREVIAHVEADGRIRFGRELYKSLSIAAGAARVSVKGVPVDGRRYYQTNGWTFWEFEDDNGKRREMQALRARLLGTQ